MLSITQITTKQLVLDYITISWTIKSTSENLAGYTFNILKGGVESTDPAEYAVIATGINPQTTYSYNDSLVAGVTSKFVDYFYKIQISGLSGQGVSYSDFGYIQVTEDKFAREIHRRRGIVFDLHSGQSFFLLKRREFGTYCPVCYDAVLQRTIKPGDTTCFGTGFVGGYFGPEELNGQLQERPVQERLTMFAAWQDQDSVLYTTPIPTLNPKDIIVDRLARRWIVINANSYSKGTHSIGQIVQLRQIEKMDIVYQFPVTY
jgi:hypothetical protein